jgi:hypothetical protein
MGVGFPMPRHGFFPKWISLQRFFSRLLVHFLPCVGFKLGGFFLRLSRLLYKKPKIFLRLPI